MAKFVRRCVSRQSFWNVNFLHPLVKLKRAVGVRANKLRPSPHQLVTVLVDD